MNSTPIAVDYAGETSHMAYRRTSCRLCSSTNLKIALPLTPTPLADSYVPDEQLARKQPVFPLDLYLCADCGFSQLLDVVQPQEIYFDYIYETKSSLGLVDHFERYAAEICRDLSPAPDALIVDIGSNDGTLLKAFKGQGLRVLGVDPAREIAKQATAEGVPTIAELFDTDLAKSILRDHGPASIITSNNLYANVDQLTELTSGIRELLADDGVFVFESYYLADLIDNMVFDFIYHEHLSSFCVTPLVSFFEQQGMQLIDAQRVPTKGGSLRYTVQKSGGPRAVNGSIKALLSHEHEQGTCSLKTFQSFTERINIAKKQLSNMLDRLKSDGKSIVGYGASATTTTFLYHFGIADRLDYLVDDYPAKQGLYAPGTHLQVLPSDVIYDRNPDCILVIAWRYFDPIAAKHVAYLKRGGTLIAPLPDLQLVDAGSVLSTSAA